MITLNPHQVAAMTQGLLILLKYRVLYYSMQVRTGKTLTALSTARELFTRVRAKGHKHRVAFITTLKAKPGIEEDYAKGGFSYELIVVNYERLDSIRNPGEIDLWVLDEAHKLGQFPKPAQRTQMLKSMIGGTYCILLSGTPTPESYSQIYHQLYVTGNSPFAEVNFYRWAKEYVDIVKRKINGYDINDYKRAKKGPIMQFCGHLFVSVTQEEAGFVSPVEEHVLSCSMSPATQKLFKTLERDRVAPLHDGTVEADTPASLMIKLSQLAGGTIIPAVNMSGIVLDPSKAIFILQRFAGKRIGIYYRFKAEYDLLAKYFPDHTTDWQAFNAGASSVYLSQVQSGREGVNLSTADALVMYNIDFSATSYWQVRARLQSRDRTERAPIYWIWSGLGIEEQVYETVKRKKNFTHSYYKRSSNAKAATDQEANIREAGTGKGKEKAGPSWLPGY